MMKEQLRVKDARLRLLEETLRVGEKASEKNEKEEMKKAGNSRLLKTFEASADTSQHEQNRFFLVGHSTA